MNNAIAEPKAKSSLKQIIPFAILFGLLLIPTLYAAKKVWRRVQAISEWQQQESIPVLASQAEWDALVTRLGGSTQAPHTVVVVTAAWCPQCRTLEEQLIAAQLPFLRADIDTNEDGAKLDALFNSRGVVGVPKVIINNFLVRADVASIQARLAKNTP